jgi:hypothetical protein
MAAWFALTQGDYRGVIVASEAGAKVADHHFVVDPSKFDFYVMDCYRILREDKLAQTYAKRGY